MKPSPIPPFPQTSLTELRLGNKRMHLNFFGMLVHVQQGLFDDASFSALLIKHEMQLATRKFQADLYVVTDPLNPGKLRQCAAVLGGAMLVDTLFFVTAGREGVAIRYAPLVEKNKIVMMTERFQAEEPGVCEAVVVFTARSSSNWHVMPAEAFIKKLANNKNKSGFMALVTPGDRATMPGLAALRIAITADEMMHRGAEIDYELSRTGLCGR